MRAFRLFVRKNRVAAWTLLAFALAMKMLVPAGFMPAMTSHGVAIVVCTGMGPVTAMTPGGHVMAGHQKGHGEPVKPDSPCAFAGLAAPSLGGADAPQLAIALAAIIAAGIFFTLVLRIPRRGFLRPPLRGPPAYA